uniref:Uncharacterized protein n=1 Tax=Avena sativa TaxID=4498 RepID=A0ACD6AFN2_AVESA
MAPDGFFHLLGAGGWARGGGGADGAERARRRGGGAIRPRIHRDRGGFAPVVDSFVGFFHAIDWKVTTISRRNIKFQLILSALVFSGIFLAEKLNTFLAQNWKCFTSQNYFDPQGLLISVMWSGPLFVITILIMVNTLVMLCMLMLRWKRAELKHRAREARKKQE